MVAQSDGSPPPPAKPYDVALDQEAFDLTGQGLPSVSLTHDMGWLALLGLAGAVCLGTLAGSEIVSPGATLLLALLLANGALALVAIVRHGTLLHPGILFGGVVVGTAALGLVVYPLVESYGPDPLIGFRARTAGAAAEAFLTFSLASFLVAAVAPRANVRGRGLTIDVAHQPAPARRALLAFVIVVSGAFLIGSNMETLLNRDDYHGFAEDSALIELFRLGNGLHIPASLVAWVLILAPGMSVRERSIAGVALGVLAFMDFATASRALGLIAVLFLVAYYLTRGFSWRVTLAAVLAAALGISIALYSRGLDDHGAFPYLMSIMSDPKTAFFSHLPTVLANLCSSFPQAGFVIIYGNEVDAAGIWSSLNPMLRSQLAYDPTAGFRVASYLPYSAVGTLGRVGLGFGFLFSTAISVGLAGLWWYGHRTVTRATIARPVLAGAGLIIAALSLQYSLRTTTRLITVLLIAVPLLLVFASRRERIATQDPTVDTPVSRRSTKPSV